MLSLVGRSSVELARIYGAGEGPGDSALLCDAWCSEWRVDMLTGPIPNLGRRPFRHRKLFCWSFGEQCVRGCNIFFGDVRWGHFRVVENAIQSTIIDYDDRSRNSFATRRIRDLVRTTDDPDVLIGKFFYDLWRFTFGPYYFSLTRL